MVDAELAALPGGLADLGDRGTEAAARRIAYRLEPAGFTARPSTPPPSGGSACARHRTR